MEKNDAIYKIFKLFNVIKTLIVLREKWENKMERIARGISEEIVEKLQIRRNK
ncbi:MAG: hypothetical protein QXW78_00425 [Candidatus Thermoplasmatota archaeon]